ncbi:stage III sporulation protein AG [Clostridium sp.]|uniref:stage III sporulation protein AG n=1 Tax=Clostridium sp. TaxID=1506 RepID=UPI0025C37A82|nr:stage III sporulation protein AG [Clostridium sp.]MBS4956616.1 stage III sporulation protein AG [Clostridium sp.]MDU4882840.1 stage III sporulation protein AG [Clostridium celatum]MDU7075798.1 stage III sporulation protein AG [Clostridium celatum]
MDKDKNKINEEINNLMQNKKFVNCLIVLLVIIFLWLAVSNFIGDDAGLTKGNGDNAPIGAQEVSSDDGVTTSKELLDYETEQKERLEEILSKIDGVGEVVVNIYFESSEVKVPATNSSTQTSETEEEDTNGGTRVTKQETEGATVVMQSDSSTSEPFITKTYKPQITGVLIVAEGAKSSKITYDIQKAVSSLYNLSLDKVNVYPMGS